VHTQKDTEILDWLARIGAAGAEHVMERFAMGRSWAYARLSRLVADGLLEQRTQSATRRRSSSLAPLRHPVRASRETRPPRLHFRP
jgi:DNA-binding IclR family transcriptional regulator